MKLKTETILLNYLYPQLFITTLKTIKIFHLQIN